MMLVDDRLYPCRSTLQLLYGLDDVVDDDDADYPAGIWLRAAGQGEPQE
jgi:hypothetical protein